MKEKQASATNERCRSSIDLVARLLVIIEFGRIKSEVFAPPGLDWSDGTL